MRKLINGKYVTVSEQNVPNSSISAPAPIDISNIPNADSLGDEFFADEITEQPAAAASGNSILNALKTVTDFISGNVNPKQSK